MFWQDHILLEWVLLTKIKTFETTGLICQNLGMEGKRRNQVCKTSVSQHIQDSHLLCWFFFWYTKGSHTASDVISCLPSCDNLWRQWGRPQPPLQMWLGACCTFKPLISLPERAQWKPKVGCFLGICSMTILVFFFQREKPHKTFQLCNHHQDMPHLVFWDLIEMPSMLLQRPCTPESAQMDVAFGLVFQRIFFTSLPFS